MRAVLIVEDDALIRADLKDALEDEGYEVVTAGSTREALARLCEKREYGLILLDMGIPDAGGSEFRERQLALEDHKHIPVVLLSGENQLNQTAKKLNAASYLQKPFRLQALLTVVAQYCRTSAQT